MASVPFSIAGRNIEIVASLAPGVAVDGRFIAEDNAKPPDFTTLKIWLDQIDMLRFADLVEPVAADATGKFQLQAVPSGNVRVMISGTGAGNYVKEIRYNGSPLRDGIVSLDQASMTRSLTIVIDDKPASLTGEVKNGDKAVSQPYVILAKWPLAGGRVFIPTATATGSDQGAFQFSGLAPGEYRVAALRSRVEDQERLPNTLERALAAARKIELGPNTFQNITIGVTEVR